MKVGAVSSNWRSLLIAVLFAVLKIRLIINAGTKAKPSGGCRGRLAASIEDNPEALRDAPWSCERIRNLRRTWCEGTPPPMTCKELRRSWRPSAPTGRIFSQLFCVKGEYF